MAITSKYSIPRATYLELRDMSITRLVVRGCKRLPDGDIAPEHRNPQFYGVYLQRPPFNHDWWLFDCLTRTTAFILASHCARYKRNVPLPIEVH